MTKAFLKYAHGPSLPGMESTSTLLVVDMQPVISNHWAVAVIDSQFAWTPNNCEGAPQTFYLGLTSDKSMHLALESGASALYMSSWWPNQPGSHRTVEDSMGSFQVLAKEGLDFLSPLSKRVWPPGPLFQPLWR